MADPQMFIAGVGMSAVVLMFFVFSAFELRKSHQPKVQKKERNLPL